MQELPGSINQAFASGMLEAVSNNAAVQMQKQIAGMAAHHTSMAALTAANIFDQANSTMSNLTAAVAAGIARDSAMSRHLAMDRIGNSLFVEAAKAASIGLDRQSISMMSRIQEDWKRIDMVGLQTVAQFANQFEFPHQLHASISAGLAASWQGSISPTLAAQIRSAFEEQVEEHPQSNVLEAAFAAIVSALHSAGIRLDNANAVNLLLLLMTILANLPNDRLAELDAQEQVAEINWHTDRVAAGTAQRQEKILALLATKEITHGTRVWSKPRSGSRVLGRIQEGALVIRITRKGPWTLVAIRAEDAPRGVAVSGWVMNKYLSKY